MKRIFGDYIILLVSVIGSLASIVMFGIYFAPHLDKQGWIGVLFLGILSLFLLAYNFNLVFNYRRKVKYADIFQDINIGFSQLHAIGRNEEPSAEIIIQKLTLLCDNVSKAFERIYETNVGVCVKFLRLENEKLLVQTLVRDNVSKMNGRKTGTSDETKHWIEGNSDFHFIYKNLKSTSIKGYYFEPKLPTREDYENTNLPDNWLPEKMRNMVFFKNFVRRRCWPLSYRSTLIVPIVPLNADDQTQDALRGFLCLDSPDEDVFNSRVDVDILKGVSDGFYNQIDRLKTII